MTRLIHFTKYSARVREEPGAGSLKTEAIVLRSMRYGEADRILHLYTPERGRLSARSPRACGAPKSRFGGRLEPFFRLRLVLHEGRSDLLTVTSAETLAGHPRLRERRRRARRRGARLRRGRAPVRRPATPHRGVYHLLGNELALLDADPARATRANALAFRLKLLLAAGLRAAARRLRVVRRGASTSSASRGAAGGVVCSACEASAFPLGQEAHDFLVGALGRPLAEAPDAPPRALRPGRAGDPRDARAPRARAAAPGRR